MQLNAECIRFEAHPRTARRYGVSCGQDPGPIIGSHVLMAVGRGPNTEDLGLDAAGVEDRRTLAFIVVDDTLRTSVPHIWATGRLQRPRRLHPYVVQRLRDRRGESAG